MAIGYGVPCPKPASRLQDKRTQKRDDTKKENAFKSLVWTRDQSRCRCCHRRVIRSIERLPERGEVHHLHGRTGPLRYEDRAALLLCLEDHERATGRVNERTTVYGTRHFKIDGQSFIDARFNVQFKRVA